MKWSDHVMGSLVELWIFCSTHLFSFKMVNSRVRIEWDREIGVVFLCHVKVSPDVMEILASKLVQHR